MTPTLSRFAALAIAALLLTAPPARGADADARKLTCATAYEQGQRLRNADRLIAARAQLTVCTELGCPEVLRLDCGKWLREVDAAMPTVVLSAVDASGTELSDVRVELDGRLLTTRIDGRALNVDPGQRRFRFVRGEADVEHAVEIAAGEKRRAIRVQLPGDAGSAAASGASDGEVRGGVPTASWVLGGVGVLGVAGFAVFALDGRAQKSKLDECRPGCSPDDVDRARRSFLIGDILLAVGVSALAGATVVYATRPDEPQARTARSRLSVSVSPSAASVGWHF